MCETLVHRIGRVKLKTIRKLLDLATDHADGEESVAFSKRKPDEEQGEASTSSTCPPLTAWGSSDLSSARLQPCSRDGSGPAWKNQPTGHLP
jgi:hypothetical protein